MSRFKPSDSYSHRITRCGEDFVISWTVDRYNVDSRLRYPAQHERSTSETGARRFAKRWDIEFPETS